MYLPCPGIRICVLKHLESKAPLLHGRNILRPWKIALLARFARIKTSKFGEPPFPFFTLTYGKLYDLQPFSRSVIFTQSSSASTLHQIWYIFRAKPSRLTSDIPPQHAYLEKPKTTTTVAGKSQRILNDQIDIWFASFLHHFVIANFLRLFILSFFSFNGYTQKIQRSGIIGWRFKTVEYSLCHLPVHPAVHPSLGCPTLPP